MALFGQIVQGHSPGRDVGAEVGVPVVTVAVCNEVRVALGASVEVEVGEVTPDAGGENAVTKIFSLPVNEAWKAPELVGKSADAVRPVT
jgi:hypothetical protein